MAVSGAARYQRPNPRINPQGFRGHFHELGCHLLQMIPSQSLARCASLSSMASQPKSWHKPCKLGLFCFFASIVLWIVGFVGTGASLLAAFAAVDSAAVSPDGHAQSLDAAFSSAHAFTWLSLGAGVLLQLVALAAFCVAGMRWLDSREHASRSTAAADH